MTSHEHVWRAVGVDKSSPYYNEDWKILVVCDGCETLGEVFALPEQIYKIEGAMGQLADPDYLTLAPGALVTKRRNQKQ